MAILPCLILATCLLTVHGTPLEWGKTISAFQYEEWRIRTVRRSY